MFRLSAVFDAGPLGDTEQSRLGTGIRDTKKTVEQEDDISGSL